MLPFVGSSMDLLWPNTHVLFHLASPHLISLPFSSQNQRILTFSFFSVSLLSHLQLPLLILCLSSQFPTFLDFHFSTNCPFNGRSLSNPCIQLRKYHVRHFTQFLFYPVKDSLPQPPRCPETSKRPLVGGFDILWREFVSSKLDQHQDPIRIRLRGLR